jgi:hypothetical protein
MTFRPSFGQGDVQRPPKKADRPAWHSVMNEFRAVGKPNGTSGSGRGQLLTHSQLAVRRDSAAGAAVRARGVGCRLAR